MVEVVEVECVFKTPPTEAGEEPHRADTESSEDVDGVISTPLEWRRQITQLSRQQKLTGDGSNDDGCPQHESTNSSSSPASPSLNKRRPSFLAMRNRTTSMLDEALVSKSADCYNSQLDFGSKDQTVIVFDWDDTLFPTSYVTEDLPLNWRLPLKDQRKFGFREKEAIQEALESCEDKAVEVLRRATKLAHVVVVTLATAGWVQSACKNYFTKVGEILVNDKVPVVYAMDAGAGRAHHLAKARTLRRPVDIENYWGCIKGQAIKEAVEKFYSRYEGQSWKNILSIGDSNFERYGLLAASWAYMLKRSSLDLQSKEREALSPAEESFWEWYDNGRLLKIRVKCCKLVAHPVPEELVVQLDLLVHWLQGMVHLDSGFDLDLEALATEEETRIVESVLFGNLPTSSLPSKHKEIGKSSEEEEAIATQIRQGVRRMTQGRGGARASVLEAAARHTTQELTEC